MSLDCKDTSADIEDIGRQLCQHVVGMNPTSLGGQEPAANKESETQLLHQEFLLEQSLTVAEFLEEKGIRLLDFVRYECGEELADTA